jgi:hypothetical protein
LDDADDRRHRYLQRYEVVSPCWDVRPTVVGQLEVEIRGLAGAPLTVGVGNSLLSNHAPDAYDPGDRPC